MKRTMQVIMVVFGLMTSYSLYSQELVSIDRAIKMGIADIEAKLESGTKIVILNFTSPEDSFSNYVIEELTAGFVQNGKLVVVDRKNLDLIQQEMAFQISGEVSDASMQEIGQKLGAQSIISGSIEVVRNYYRIRFRTINVTTAAIEVLSNINVKNDTTIASLLGAGIGNNAPGILSAPIPEGVTQTAGGIGAGFLNIVFGAGSLFQKDWLGGAIVGGSELLGGIFLLVALGIDPYHPASGRYEDGNYTDGYNDPDAELAKDVLLFGGLGLFVGGMIYGFIRPFQYAKQQAQNNPLAFSPNNINIGLLPGKNGIEGVSLLYSIRF
ncbi:hypothetical protein FACS1894151_03930 [Spirochaetia bacterium]|nr:hypothetical protein FACS1894151_03930 [Spirochaetia bacterium]